MAGMEVLLKQLGLTPDKIEDMARPIVEAIMNRVREFDANEQRRHNEVMAKLDSIEASLGSTEPAGIGAAELTGDADMDELERRLHNPEPIPLSDELGGGTI